MQEPAQTRQTSDLVLTYLTCKLTPPRVLPTHPKPLQVLEPKNDKSIATRDWDKMDSDISELGLWDDDEQPLPTNVMYPGAWAWLHAFVQWGAVVCPVWLSSVCLWSLG
jgi:hypothetical protein